MMRYQNLPFFLSTIGKRFANPNAMYVELEFDSVPVLTTTTAPLLYDKKLAFSVRFDDTYRSAYTNSMAIFLGKSFLADESGIEHDGFRYTDGCGNDIPYVADFAAQVQAINTGGASFISWDDAFYAKNFGYGLIPQGCYVDYHPTVTTDINGDETYHSPYSEWYNDFVQYRSYCQTNLNFKPVIATSDIGYEYWSSILDGSDYKAPFFDAGMSFITANDNPKEIAGVLKFNDVSLGLDVENITSDTFNSGNPYPCLYHSKRILYVSELPTIGELYYIYQLPDYTMYRWDGTNFYITIESTAGSVPLEDIKNSITNAINNTHARALGIFTHRLDYNVAQNDNGGMYLPYFKSIFEWLDVNYGKTGTDQILMSSMNTVVEYLYCRERSIINTYREGKKVILEIIPPVNSDLRRPSLTLKLNSSVPVKGISIHNIDKFSQNVLNTTDGIINLEWGQEYYNVANYYVTIAESIRTQKSVEVAQYFTNSVSDETKRNELQSRILNIVVIESNTYLIDFGRTVYEASIPPYNNVSSDVLVLSGSTVVNDLTLRDIGNTNYGAKLTIVQQFDTMSYDGVNTGNDSGIYSDEAIQDSYNCTAGLGTVAIIKIHGLLSGQTIDVECFASKAGGLTSLTDYTVVNSLTSPTFSVTKTLNAMSNTGNTAIMKYGFCNENGELFIKVNGNTTYEGRLSVLEITTHAEIVSPDFLINSISINNGIDQVSTRNVDVTVNFIGTPTHYIISEVDSFSGSSWTSFSGITGDTIPFLLSEGNAIKSVFVQLRDSTLRLTNISTDDVLYSLNSKIVVSWGNGGTSSQVDVNGEIINFFNFNRGTTLTNLTIQDTDGISKGLFIRDTDDYPTDLWVKSFSITTGYNPILSGDTGPYPDLYFSKYLYPQNVNVSGNKGLLRFTQLSPGSYSIRLYISNNYVVTVAKQETSYYQIGTDTPVQFNSPMSINTIHYTDLTCTVGIDGILDLYCFNTGGTYSFPGVNIIEIVKTS